MTTESSRNILLVEDEAFIAMITVKNLTNYGYNVYHVFTGESAIEFILQNSQPIDLILMDINLGGAIDGTQAAEKILEQKKIPILFLSSHTEPDVVEKTEKITSYGYVVKSSTITVLDASIKMAFKLKDAYDSIEHERNNLGKVFNANPLGMMVINQHYEVINVNLAAERIAGRSLSNSLHLRCGDFLGCVNIQFEPNICGSTNACSVCSLYADIKHAILENKIAEYIEREFTVEKNDPETNKPIPSSQWIRYSVAPIRLDKSPGAVIVFEDITQQRKTDSHLRQFQRLIDSDNVIVVTTDKDRKTIWCNNGLLALTGYSYEELIGKNLGELLQGPNPDQELRNQMTQAFDKGLPYQTDILNYNKQGTPYWIHMDVQPLHDTYGNLEGFIAIQRDITTEKRLKADLEERDHRS